LILVSALMGLLMAGCGSGGGESGSVEKPSPRPPAEKKVRVSLDGQASPANVAILMALDRGFFSDLGMEVWQGAPVLPSRPVSYVTSGTVDFGIAQQPQILIAKENGARIVAVGSLVSQPTAAMIWLGRSGFRDISDLKGKTIAMPGIPYEEGLLESVLQRAGLALDDVKLKRVAYQLVPALLSGRADAIFGGSWNLEGVTLRKRGAEPVIMKAQELGIPGYEELAVVTRSHLAAEKPGMIRNFMSAVARGSAAAVEDPERAVRVIEEDSESNPEATPAITRAQVEATLPLLSQTGSMDTEQVGDLAAWMHEQGIVQSVPPTSELFTNEYLAKP
jgi:ABC-type nitrate/sulfonate/bicarbonate transport system substrate-binding protein